MNQLHFLPCLDSAELAAANRQALDIQRQVAADLGHSAVAASSSGIYHTTSGMAVDFSHSLEAAKTAKLSIAPDDPLPPVKARPPFPKTQIRVTNETTLVASRRLVDRNLRPLALNFANGISPGGGFLSGSRAQEEVLCRSSALYETLVDDPMYQHHRGLPHKHSSDWVILSPDVPVFRNDDGSSLETPWLLSFITSAAPVCDFSPADISRLVASDSDDPTHTALALLAVGKCRDLLRRRIHRVLAIAESNGYETLVLGAWGCGAFNNDPVQTAADFRAALENDFPGSFSEVVFAITDWSPERRFLGPFRDTFQKQPDPMPPTSNPKMTVTRSDGSTFEVSLEPSNGEDSKGFLEPKTGLRLEVSDGVVRILEDDSYPPGLKFPAYILPATWGLEADTPVRDVLAEIARCGKRTGYILSPGNWLTNDQGWIKCEFHK